jgi:hypothetical protein
MSKHLSADQFEACLLDRAGSPELEHLSACPECQAEVERFSKGVTLFRKAVWDLAGEPSVLEKTNFATFSPPSTRIARWGLALATAAAAATLAAAVVLPFFISRPEPIGIVQGEMSPEAVMDRLNRHLAGTVPEALEPAMSLIYSEPPASEPGGTR